MNYKKTLEPSAGMINRESKGGWKQKIENNDLCVGNLSHIRSSIHIIYLYSHALCWMFSWRPSNDDNNNVPDDLDLASVETHPTLGENSDAANSVSRVTETAAANQGGEGHRPTLHNETNSGTAEVDPDVAEITAAAPAHTQEKNQGHEPHTVQVVGKTYWEIQRYQKQEENMVMADQIIVVKAKVATDRDVDSNNKNLRNKINGKNSLPELLSKSIDQHRFH